MFDSDRANLIRNSHFQFARVSPSLLSKGCAQKLPESRGERILFHGQPNLWPIFREISCAHFSLKLKDENRRKMLPFSRRIFLPCRRKISPEFRSQGFAA